MPAEQDEAVVWRFVEEVINEGRLEAAGELLAGAGTLTMAARPLASRPGRRAPSNS